MGADSFAGFSRWHRAAEIPFVASLIVASRPGQFLDNLDSALPDGLMIEAVPALDDLATAKLDQEGGVESEGGGGFNPRIPPIKPARALAPEEHHSPAAIALHRYILRNPAGQQAPFYLLPGLHIDISASDIRDQIRNQALPSATAQNPHPDLLPPPVLEYIRARNLYH